MTGGWRYWLDFFLFPIVCVAAIAADCRSLGWVAFFALGFCSWTFVEYWVHRSLLHRWFWHGVHETHHNHPSDYVVAIWWYAPLLFAALYFLIPVSVFAGFACGYVWFQIMHHWLHHIDLAPHAWLHRYSIWHNRHHKLADCNYGITTPVWDWVFGTSR